MRPDNLVFIVAYRRLPWHWGGQSRAGGYILKRTGSFGTREGPREFLETSVDIEEG